MHEWKWTIAKLSLIVYVAIVILGYSCCQDILNNPVTEILSSYTKIQRSFIEDFILPFTFLWTLLGIFAVAKIFYWANDNQALISYENDMG